MCVARRRAARADCPAIPTRREHELPDFQPFILTRDLHDRLIAAGGGDLDHRGLHPVIDA